MNADSRLIAIKMLHTVVWAFFAGCIVAIPLAARDGRLALAGALIAIVMVESLVLVLNRWRCPLTAVAARYTTQRQANFDIYLPLWLARYNQPIFGGLYVLGIAYTLVRWWQLGVAG